MFVLFYSPLEQFELVLYDSTFLVGLTYVFTVLNYYNIYENNYVLFLSNDLIYIMMAIISIYFFFYLSLRKMKVMPSNIWEFLIERFFFIILDIIEEQLPEDAAKLFSIFLTVFLFILFSNLVGLTPYAYTPTSLLIQNIIISLSFLIGITCKGFLSNGPEILNLVVPTGIPNILVPFLTFIEVVSYVSRGFSLGIRLFANMMAGHTLITILAGFSFKLGTNIHGILGFVPFIIVLLISFLEVGIAVLQAYVFMILLCIYMNDALCPNDH